MNIFDHTKKFFVILLLLLSVSRNSFSQNTSPNKFLEWTTWTLFQAIPSPTFYQDRNDNDARLQFGFRWHVTPVNYSFNANKLVSPVQFFLVNPVRRYGGSLELLIEPEWATGGYQYSNLQRFNLSAGARAFIPAIEYGEYLAFSVAGKYNFTKNKSDQSLDYYSAEAGLYTLFGIAGIVFNYNFTSQSRYNISLNLKYY
ncbi:MAG: hypothetical protein IPL53_17450 [Ignavibacteria bacterium]|nr:hypothetical protein [Ignavibacteria bacterium]